eukprot:365796-Chlamydomonas_euryale.AAC.4
MRSAAAAQSTFARACDPRCRAEHFCEEAWRGQPRTCPPARVTLGWGLPSCEGHIRLGPALLRGPHSAGACPHARVTLGWGLPSYEGHTRLGPALL